MRASTFSGSNQVRLNVAILAAVLLGTGAVAAWGFSQQRVGDAGEFEVEAVGPEGPLFLETVRLEDATALSALQAAASARGLGLDLEEYPGMGTYVRGVGEHRAEGATGWIYEVERDGAWISGDRSAEFFGLQKGDALRWSWTAG